MRSLIIVACLLFGAPAKAGLNTACHQWPVTGQPAAAAAFNYNCLAFDPSVRSLSNIDVSDTADATKDWFTHNTFPNTPAPSTGGWNFDIIQPSPSTDYSITTEGKLLLAPVSNTPYQGLPVELMTCRYSATAASGYIGRTFGPGYYVEMRSALSFTNSADSGSWNIGWMVALNQLVGTSPWRVSEIDIIEYLNSGWNFAFHDWSGTGQTVTFNDQVQSTFSIYSGSAGVFKTLAVQLVPAQFNGGTTGTIKRYQDDVHATDSDVSFTASAPSSPAPSGGGHNGNFTPFNSQQDCFAIAAGASQTHTFEFARIWTR